MSGRSRRDLLGAVAAAGAAGLAGCLDALVASDGDDGDDGENAELAVADVTAETVDARCGSGADEAALTVDGEVVEVDGVISAPNPCHEAVVDADVSGTELTVDVTLEAEDVECAQCVGAIEYGARIELTDDGIEDVRVNHEGEEVDVARNELDDDDSRDGSEDDGNDSDDGNSGDESDDTDDNDDGSDGSGEYDLPVVSVETLDADCGTDEETTDATVEDDALVVEGVIVASNPCHEAVVTDATYADGVATVAVGVSSTLAENEACMDCLGQVSYEVTLDVEDVTVDEVVVDHEGNSSHTVTPR